VEQDELSPHALTELHYIRGKFFKKLTTEPLAGVGGYENPRGFCFVGRPGGWRRKVACGRVEPAISPGRREVNAGREPFTHLAPLQLDQMALVRGVGSGSVGSNTYRPGGREAEGCWKELQYVVGGGLGWKFEHEVQAHNDGQDNTSPLLVFETQLTLQQTKAALQSHHGELQAVSLVKPDGR
jgi:hypothetical protein